MPYILVMTKQRIVLIACVKEKKSERCMAKDMYVSSAFQSWMNYAESWGANQIYILSGKHGLLALNEFIDPYDFNLNTAKPEERKKWAKQVISKLSDKTELKEDTFLVLANSIYAEYLTPHLSHYAMPLKID
tara:strand:- start:1194 stop:1589 length:396 start_codon:yes stop_codon:yes gene_type:complete